MMDVRADKQWLTAAEAAAEKLPGLPARRTIQLALASGEIKWRKREARGGGREFHWTDLPAPARAEYLKRYGVAAQSTPALPAARAADLDVTNDARRRAVEASKAFIAERALPTCKGLKAFSAAYEARQVKLDSWVFGIVPHVAPHQIRRWKLCLARETAPLQKRGRKAGSGSIEANEALRNFIVAHVAANSHFTAAIVLKAIKDAKRADLPVPKKRTLQHFLMGFRDRNAAALKALAHPDKFRSHHRPAYGTLSHGVTINSRWELDASPADAICRLPDGGTRRMKLVALIDVFTRRARVVVVREASAFATMALLRRAIVDFGVPQTIKTDNGKEFRNRAVEHFCAAQGIELTFSQRFSPHEKGHIERFFGTISHELFPTLPGFVGHNVADREAIRSRQTFAHRFGEDANLAFAVDLAPAELQARIDLWCSAEYEQRVHSEIKLAPAQKALAHEDAVRRLADESALDALVFAVSGLRTIGKRGIRFENRTFVAPELAAYLTDRRQVAISLDPSDPARILVFTADRSRFLCIARDVDALANEDRIRVAREAVKAQNAVVRQLRGDVRKALTHHPLATLGDRLLIAAAGEAANLNEPDEGAKRAMIAAATPQVRAALSAKREAEADALPQQPIEPTDEQAARASAMFAEIDARAALPAPSLVQCDGYQRPAFERDIDFWFWAQDRIGDGLPLDGPDSEFLADLTRSSVFQLQLSAFRAKRANA